MLAGKQPATRVSLAELRDHLAQYAGACYSHQSPRASVNKS